MSVSRPQGVPFWEKWVFAFKAVKKHGLLLCLLSVFILAGLGVIWLAYSTDAPWFVYGIGAVFTLFGLVFLLVTMPSSLMFYYEKQMVAKYGRNKEAVVTGAYSEALGGGADTLYYFDYEFEYKKTRQFGTFYLEDKALAEKLTVGDAVPIKFLAFDPTQSDVRMRSLLAAMK